MKMLLRTKELKQKTYSQKADEIKKKLSTYSDMSFIRNMFAHFQKIREPKVGIALNFPWCCFLAMKWKYTTKSKIHTHEMSYENFVNIINRIYHLQSEAANLLQDDRVLLSLRRMMVNQLLYRNDDWFNFNALTRQYLWYCNSENDWYAEAFFKATNLELNVYYKIAFYLSNILSINKNVESEHIPISQIIIHLVPLYGGLQVKQFLNLTSLKLEEIREFLTRFKLDNNITMEYYEDTPMLSKPLILNDDGLVVLSKKVMMSGFVNLVPELLKSHYNEEYKKHFGKTLENYASSFLEKYNYNFMGESDIKRIYSDAKISGKAVDFLIQEKDANIYIDCKAIEPGKYIKTSNDPKRLRQRLESSFIKGIIQGEECAFHLNRVANIKPSTSDALIIVIHRDHYISNAKVVEETIHPNIFDEITEKCSDLHIMPDRIYYATIDEFERMLCICKEKNMPINEIVSYFSKGDSEARSQKFNVMMHLTELTPEGVKDEDWIINAKEVFLDEILDGIKNGSHIWDGKASVFLNLKKIMMQ